MKQTNNTNFAKYIHIHFILIKMQINFNYKDI